MDTINIGALQVSKFIIGGNPFSGFSHQGTERDLEMRRYYTAARIKETLHQAEEFEINTFLGRCDAHITRVLFEYWDEGGTIQWLAQTCPEYGAPENSIKRAIAGGAKACYIHGGVMDFLLAQSRLDEVPAAIEMIKSAGLAAGVAGHNPQVFPWAEEHLDVDFYMCSYYNPSPREKTAAHVSGVQEHYAEEDRQAMIEVLRSLSKPVIHYKVLAAGRHKPSDAFAYVAQHLRAQDAVAVGVFPKDKGGMLDEDVQFLAHNLRIEALRKRPTPSPS